MNLSHELGMLRIENVGETIKVAGWVQKKRNLGELIFIDLRDRSGVLQIVLDKSNKFYEVANQIKNEYVIEVEGTVKERSNKNEKISTGEVEVEVSLIKIINKAKALPVQIEEEVEALEDTRLEYRYLDLRRPNIQKNLITRHKLVQSIRNYLNDSNFIEIETPILTKSTPEGARDYLVPSRVNAGSYYALPQSPQIYKNLLMVGGISKYYQVAKCFRDEDLRADRQPEFTQIDIEMSFMSEDEIRDIIEKMIKKVVLDLKNLTLEKFPIMSYDDAMRDYGIDKPDIRFGLKLKKVSHIFKSSEFKVFASANMIKCIKVEADFTRKDIEKLEKVVKDNHAKGLAWLKYSEEFTGPIAKFLSEKEKDELKKELDVKNGDILFFVADNEETVNQALAALRNHLGRELKLYDENELAFLWVVDWPMFEYDEELERYFAVHHPFTMPQDNKFNYDNLLETRAQAYDIVLNGFELGGGSIRINNPGLQMEMFKILGMEEEEIKEDFGFLLEAYSYGGPYHGGVALGLDRFAMLMTNSDSIRDVIAFPKNAKAKDTMLNAPSSVSLEQLKELNIKQEENEKN